MFPKYTRVILCNGKEYHLTEAWTGEIVVKQEGSDKPLDWQSNEYLRVVCEYNLTENILPQGYQ